MLRTCSPHTYPDARQGQQCGSAPQPDIMQDLHLSCALHLISTTSDLRRSGCSMKAPSPIHPAKT